MKVLQDKKGMVDEMSSGQRRGGRKTWWFLLPFFTLFLFWAGTTQAAENAECLKCHKNPRLSKGKKDGSLLSLYVNEEAFKASVHGAAGMGCVDCHQEAKPNFHPAEGFAEVGCASCHADQVEAYKKTAHGLAWASGLERAPKCQDCHTSHYMRKIKDPQSPVQASRLGAVCAKCHEEAKPPEGFLAALATYRLMGHRKVNLGDRYDTKGCANCHPHNSGHPQKEEPAPSCVKCHDRSISSPLLMGPIHFKMSLSEQPIPFFLRILYGAGLIIVVVGCIGFFSYRYYRRKKATQEGADKPAEGEQ
ncbi:MAG: cytochrome c3 family protein [Thermodesulfobacteriota bacterium]|nr:cytochrome c3 family protein [Thermodesulfobacteriota bacterium]